MDESITRLRRGGVAATIIFFLCSGIAPVFGDAVNGNSVDVRVGVFENRPIAFRDADGNAKGLAIDVLEDVARRENWRLTYVYLSLADLLDHLERGDIDLAASLVPNAARMRVLRFNEESLIDNWGIVYKARGAPIVGLLDLKHRRIALTRKSVHSDEFNELLARFNIPYIPIYVDSHGDVLQTIATREADAGVVSRLFGAINADRYDIDVTGIVFNPVYTHFASDKDGDPGMIPAIDRHLRALKADPHSLYYVSLNRWVAGRGARPMPIWITWILAGFTVLLCATLGGAWLLRRQARHALERSRAIQERFNEAVYLDSLTGLPNRTAFRERFPSIVSDADRSETKIGILFVNIDRLKNVNDSLGHAAGDVLIRTVAERLRGCLRANDSIYRFGGDEFIVSVGRIRTITDVETVATRLLASLKEPIDAGGRMLYVSASMGVALYPDDDRTLEGLLKSADAAMYYAKERGRDRFQLYQRDLTARVVERLDTQTRLHRALERNEFSLHYQPIVELVSGNVVGAEALLRWNDPERGVISPVMFIPHAEESGAIVPIGAWVLARACVEAVAWQQNGFGSIAIAVNVSSRQFEDKHLIVAVEHALRSSGLAPPLLELEITEGVLLATNHHVRETLQELKRLGVRVVIDDFGTGYSSLTYLKQFPIDGLKIDRSFVSGIPDSASDSQIAATIIGMAGGLGLTVVAEGIETQAQLDFLQTHDCGLGQGYHIARPTDAGQFQLWLGDRQRQRLRVRRAARRSKGGAQ